MALVYTETTIVEMWRDTVGDPSSNPAQRWTDAEAVRYLNRGAAMLIADIPMTLHTQWTINSVLGTREYQLPGDFIADTRVEYIVDTTNNDDDRVLTYLDEEEWKRSHFSEDKSETGTPQYYTYSRKLGDTAPTTAQNKHLILHPAPDVSGTNNIRVHGFKLMQTIESGGSDAIELATPKVEAIVMYAAAVALRSDGDGRSDRFRGEYEAQVRKILNLQAEQSFSRPSRMKSHLSGDDQYDPLLPYERRIT